MQCVILAGGQATRMAHLSKDLPKALFPVHGEPFIHYQLSWLAQQGVNRVVLSLGFKGEMIRKVVGNGEVWSIAVDYVDEGDQLMGTAGAIRLAADAGVLDDGFFVLYGDSFLPISFEAVWENSRRGRQPVMTVLRNEGRWDKSNVIFQGNRILLYDKLCGDPISAGMNYIDYGLSVLPRRVIEGMVPPERVMDLGDVFHQLSQRGSLGGYEVHARFYEIGSVSGLQDFELYIKDRMDS